MHQGINQSYTLDLLATQWQVKVWFAIPCKCNNPGGDNLGGGGNSKLYYLLDRKNHHNLRESLLIPTSMEPGPRQIDAEEKLAGYAVYEKTQVRRLKENDRLCDMIYKVGPY